MRRPGPSASSLNMLSGSCSYIRPPAPEQMYCCLIWPPGATDPVSWTLRPVVSVWPAREVWVWGGGGGGRKSWRCTGEGWLDRSISPLLVPRMRARVPTSPPPAPQPTRTARQSGLASDVTGVPLPPSPHLGRRRGRADSGCPSPAGSGRCSGGGMRQGVALCHVRWLREEAACWAGPLPVAAPKQRNASSGTLSARRARQRWRLNSSRSPGR